MERATVGTLHRTGRAQSLPAGRTPHPGTSTHAIRLTAGTRHKARPEARPRARLRDDLTASASASRLRWTGRGTLYDDPADRLEEPTR